MQEGGPSVKHPVAPPQLPPSVNVHEIFTSLIVAGPHAPAGESMKTIVNNVLKSRVNRSLSKTEQRDQQQRM